MRAENSPYRNLLHNPKQDLEIVNVVATIALISTPLAAVDFRLRVSKPLTPQNVTRINFCTEYQQHA